MMMAGGNADGKQSEQVEGDDNLRTVEFLRGRLLAERAASRNAKEEADRLGNELIALEIRLQEETKSRNKAEKRLKALMKKLESLEIFYVSDESKRSGFLEKAEISSASSVASTGTKEAEDLKQGSAILNVTPQNIEELPVEDPPPKSTSVFPCVDSKPKDASQFTASSSESCGDPANEDVVNRCPQITAHEFETAESRLKISSPERCPANLTIEETSSSSIEAHMTKSCAIASSQNDQEFHLDSHSFEHPIEEEILNGRQEQEEDDNVDNSLALVAVDLPKTEQRIDPVVLDATVKEVLDSLRHAKEKLQTSMERRRMIQVG